MELSSFKLKKLFVFQEELPKSENKKIHIFCLLKENFSNVSAEEKRAKFYKLK